MIDSTKARTKKIFLLFGNFFLLFLFNAVSVSAKPAYSSSNTTWPLFLFIFIIGLVFVFLGILARSPLLPTIGIIMIIICGFLMLQGRILVPDGSTEVVVDNTTSITFDYQNWDDGNNELIGFILIVSGFALIYTIGNRYLSEDG